MDRRDAIKNIGIGFGAFVATPAALSILKSCGPSMEPWTPAYFSEQQGTMLRKLVDGILPGVDDLPSATNANVHVFIDKYLAEVVPDEDQKMDIDVFVSDDVDLNDVVWNENRIYFKKNLDLIMSSLLKYADASSVDDVSNENVNAFLEKNFAISEEEEGIINDKIKEKYFQGTKPDQFSDKERQSLTLRSIREMSIWAYRINEIVGKNVLAYDPVPGTFIGCGDLQELSGGRDWAEGTSLVL